MSAHTLWARLAWTHIQQLILHPKALPQKKFTARSMLLTTYLASAFFAKISFRDSAYGALESPNADAWFDTYQAGGCNGWLYSDVRSDIAYKGGGGIADCANFHAMEVFTGVYPQHGHINGKWFNLYCSLQRANSALVVLKRMTKEEFPERDSRIGEMRFLRAYFFFELQRLFNRIPYFDENTEIGDYVSIYNREFTREELLDKIADDLAEAAKLLPENQPEVGRANKFTAYALQAKVLLYRAYEQGVDYDVVNINTEKLEQVVALCDKLDGHYTLLADFQDLDKIEYDNGDESVFEIQFSHDDGTVLHRTSWFYALCSPTAAQYAGCGFFLPVRLPNRQRKVIVFKTIFCH